MKIYIDGELPKSCASCLFLMHCDECEGHENYCTLIGHVGYDPSDNLIDGAPVTPSSERHEDCPLEQRPRGKWTEEFDESANPFFQRRWRCSACNDYNYYGRPDFCPCCGAEMQTQNDRSLDTSERGVSGSVENSIAQKEGDDSDRA